MFGCEFLICFLYLLVRERIDDATAAPFRNMIQSIAERFHVVYVKAAADHTVRTDVPERVMFSSVCGQPPPSRVS